MENREFFLTNGFNLIANNTSEYFGDYYDIYKKGNTYFRIIKDKSAISIDISNNNESWYDLALVKALLYNENNLIHVTTIEEYWDLLRKKMVDVVNLFDSKNYPTTKERLDKLKNERVKQMFPK